MEKKNNTQIDNLITNYLLGDVSKDEISLLEAWIHESNENLAYFSEMKNIWEVSEELPVSTEKALEKLMIRISRKDGKFRFLFSLQRIAAILFIPLLISTLWIASVKTSENLSENIIYNKAFAAFGSYSKIVLPDGSKVWLNSGSSLQYPDRFTSLTRRVILDGEAYFEVQSDSTTPFLVSTEAFTVKATGTRFNVMAYNGSPAPSVTLVEGKLAIQKVSIDNRTGLISLLHAEQHLVYDTLSGNVTIVNGDIYKHISWKDGKLVFRGDLIAEVAVRISRQYNVDIETEGDKIKHYRFRATFENESLDEVLSLLKMSSPIDYREIKPESLPDGRFSRRKIILFSTEK